MGDFRHERVRGQRTSGGGGRTGTFGRGPVLATTLLALGAAAGVAPAAASADPPAGRAYERVSPIEKPSGANGLSTRQGGLAMPARSADVGERLVYGLTANVGNSPSSAPNPLIFGERTATGWRARTAIRSTDDGNTPLEVALHEARAAWLTADGREIAFGTGRPLGWMVGGAFGQIYRAADTDAAPTWLSEPTGGIAPAPGIQAVTLSTGDDTRSGAFASTVKLTPDGPASVGAVYGFRNGGLELVSRLPDGSVPTVNSSLANSATASTLNGTSPPARTKRNEVAGNGRFVLFFSGGIATSSPLYVRDMDQDVTRQLAGGIGQPQLAVSLFTASGGPGFATVPNGLAFGAKGAARAFFVGQSGSGGSLTTGIFEANLETGAVTARPAINGTPLELSADGRRMLFITAPTGTARQLRHWDAANPGTSDLVATIDTATVTSGYARVFTPASDGQTWIFSAAGSPDPARPNVAPNTRQLYRWKVGQATPTCLSCEPVDGVARTSGVNLAVQDGGLSESLLNPAATTSPGDDTTLLAEGGHGLSEDGRWLLFDSPDQLVDEDENTVRDVYLWDRDGGPGGQLQLVTSGQGNTPSWALDLSPDGVNAFFLTREGLVPADKDGAADVYTARIGTGFPEDPDESCVGEECRPALIPDPPKGPIGSTDQTPASKGKGQEVQAGTPKLRVRSVRTASRQVTVRVDTPGAGRIRVSGKTVRTTTRTAKRATTYTLRVPLSASTKKRVARGRSVKVSLRVSFTPTGATKATQLSTSVTIKKGR